MKVKQIYELRVDDPDGSVYLEPMTHEREFTEEEYKKIVNSAAIEAVKRLLDRGEETRRRLQLFSRGTLPC